MSTIIRFSMRLVVGIAVIVPLHCSAMTLFQMTTLSQEAKDALVVHFDAKVGVTTVPGFDDVETWEGRDGNGGLVTTAQFMGPGAFGDILWTGTSIRFAEAVAVDRSRLQTTLSTSGNQYTVFWKGFYSNANTNGVQDAGIYAYNLTNFGTNAPGINHQRDDDAVAGGYRIETYTGVTFPGDDITAFDNTTTVWTTVYDYANARQSAFANHTDLHLTGAPTLSLTADPTLIIGAFDDGTNFNGSAFNFLGDMEQLLIFDSVLSQLDILKVQEYLGLDVVFPILTIDRESGEVSLKNGGQSPLAISGYSFSTPAGGFDRTNWLPIAGTRDNSIMGDGTVDHDDIWQIDGNPTDATLAESTTGAAELNPGQVVSLGSAGVWVPYFDETVTATVFDGSGMPLQVPVEFEGGPGVPYEFGDINFSGGAPDVADWTYLRSVYGDDLTGLSVAQAYGLGDLNGDGIHSLLDLQVFRDAFVAGGGNLASLSGAEVPEPNSLLLTLLGIAIMLLGKPFTRIRKAARGANGLVRYEAILIAFVLCLTHRGEAVMVVDLTAATGTNTTTNGAAVTTWTSFTSAGNTTFTEAAGGGAARYITDSGDGIPAIDFDRSAPFLGNFTTANGAATIGDATIFVWANFDGYTQHDITASSYYYSIDGSGNEHTLGRDGTALRSDYLYSFDGPGEATGVPTSTNQPQPAGWNLYIARFYGASLVGTRSMEAWIDNSGNGAVVSGTPDLVNEDGVAYNANANALRVGTWTNGGSGLDGQIRALRIYNSILSEQEMKSAAQSITGYLNLGPTLTIDTSSREMKIIGGQNAADINGYEILSPGGSLDSATWLANNFAAKNLDPIGTETGQTWEVFASSSDRLTEAFLFGSSVFDLNRTVSLGASYNSTIDARDIIFQYQTTSGLTQYGVVEYVETEGIPGDFNGDGIVNAADYVLWRDMVGRTGPGIPADANGDEAVDQIDYGIWKQNFGAPSFASSSGQSSANVPEPSTAVLTLLAVLLLGGIGRRW